MLWQLWVFIAVLAAMDSMILDTEDPAMDQAPALPEIQAAGAVRAEERALTGEGATVDFAAYLDFGFQLSTCTLP